MFSFQVDERRLQWSKRDCQPAAPISPNGVESVLKKMSKRKAGDSRGVVVEMLQWGGKKLMSQLPDLFTDILDPGRCPPAYWRKTRLTVLFKKGEKEEPENCRPISILPILYKIFAKLLDQRIAQMLDQVQSVDQAGFRRGFGCEDHLSSIALLAEKMHEVQLPLWVAAIDFKKAFDCVEHECIWTALAEMGVPEVYVRILASLYDGQTGEGTTDKASRSFVIQRGTKQGDPLSPKIFHAVLESLIRPLRSRRNGGQEGGA